MYLIPLLQRIRTLSKGKKGRILKQQYPTDHGAEPEKPVLFLFAGGNLNPLETAQIAANAAEEAVKKQEEAHCHHG